LDAVIVTSGGRSDVSMFDDTDPMLAMLGSVSYFPCLSLIIITSKEGSKLLALFLYRTFTMKVNL